MLCPHTSLNTAINVYVLDAVTVKRAIFHAFIYAIYHKNTGEPHIQPPYTHFNPSLGGSSIPSNKPDEIGITAYFSITTKRQGRISSSTMRVISDLSLLKVSLKGSSDGEDSSSSVICPSRLTHSSRASAISSKSCHEIAAQVLFSILEYDMHVTALQ